MGTFVTTWDGWEYTLTEEDRLWLAVAAYGETHGGNDSDEWGRMMWTWLNRFMLHGARPRVWPTLASLIRDHSQPVNPKWRSDGQYCRPGGAKEGKPDCSTSRLAWRSQMAEYLATGEYPPNTFEFVARFDNGEIRQPVSSNGLPYVDFASNYVAKNFGDQIGGTGNWYLDKQQMSEGGLKMSFSPESVIFKGSSDFRGGSPILPKLLVGAIALWSAFVLFFKK